jgi:PKD repeat protein
VTNEIMTFDPTFIVEDFIYQRKTGGNIIDMPFSPKDSSLLREIVCEDKPTLAATFTGPKSACPNVKVIFKNTSTDIPNAEHTWILNGETIMKKGDLEYTFPKEGSYTVKLIVSYACISSVFEQAIEIKPQDIISITDSLCQDKIYFKGKEYLVPEV